MSHYFDSSPDSAHQIKTIDWTVQTRSFSFLTDQSVFSRTRIDYGTERLIHAFLSGSEKKNGRLLDLGCGYGVVGIVAKRFFPALSVVMSDMNARAIGLAKKNARRNDVRYVDVVQSDGLAKIEGTFDIILTNPPVRAGKETVFRFFTEAAERLNPGGVLYVVMRKQQGALSAQKKLESVFHTVQIVDRSAGYRVMRAQVQEDVTIADPTCL